MNEPTLNGVTNEFWVLNRRIDLSVTTYGLPKRSSTSDSRAIFGHAISAAKWGSGRSARSQPNSGRRARVHRGRRSHTNQDADRAYALSDANTAPQHLREGQLTGAAVSRAGPYELAALQCEKSVGTVMC
jgi:hypothetical protein